MAEQTPEEMLVRQILSLSWIRCLQEEGVDFRNKRTGQVEKDEALIFEAFEMSSGLFDLPSAKASRLGLEKNILEMIGSYWLYNTDPYLGGLLLSEGFKTLMQRKIEDIKKGA